LASKEDLIKAQSDLTEKLIRATSKVKERRINFSIQFNSIQFFSGGYHSPTFQRNILKGAKCSQVWWVGVFCLILLNVCVGNRSDLRALEKQDLSALQHEQKIMEEKFYDRLKVPPL